MAVNESGPVDLAAAVGALRARGLGRVLSEGGPTLFASLLAAGLVDELFLTVSPLLAGRGSNPRLGLIEGVELSVESGGARCELRSARRHDDHLFLRYALR